jgi:hypothetical protein
MQADLRRLISALGLIVVALGEASSSAYHNSTSEWWLAAARMSHTARSLLESWAFRYRTTVQSATSSKGNAITTSISNDLLPDMQGEWFLA